MSDYTPAVVIDTETRKFAPGYMCPEVACLTFATDTPATFRMDDRGIRVGHDDIRRTTHDLFTRAVRGEFILVGQYMAYDTSVLMGMFPELTPLIFDAYAKGRIGCTKINEKLIDISRGTHGIRGRGYSLDEMVLRRLNIDIREDKSGADSWRLRFGELIGVPLESWPEAAVDYAVNDPVLTLKLLRNQEDRCREMQYSLPDAEHQARADFALRLASIWGMETDKPTVDALITKIDKRMSEIFVLLRAAGLVSATGSKSTKAMQAIVEAALGEDTPRTGNRKHDPLGAVKIDKLTLEDVDDPRVELWREYAGLQKTRGTYVVKFYERLIHAAFNGLVDSGRTSCREPNVQNLPRFPGVRECLRARPGYVLAASDFDSQEMRTWAQACVEIVGSSRLAERYRAEPDFDPHTAFAAISLGISEAEALARRDSKDKEVSREFKKGPRQHAKIGNFGLPGGMGVPGLIGYARGYGLRIDEATANAIRETWRTAWPEQSTYFAHISSLVGSGGSGMMEQLYSGRRRGNVGYCDAANSYFQGLAADGSKEALWQVTRRCYDETMGSALYGCRPWNFVHDEVIVEAPEDYAAEAAEEMKVVMQDALQKWIPDVPARATSTLMRHWSKSAEPVRDDSGRLIPWDDR